MYILYIIYYSNRPRPLASGRVEPEYQSSNPSYPPTRGFVMPPYPPPARLAPLLAPWEGVRPRLGPLKVHTVTHFCSCRPMWTPKPPPGAHSGPKEPPKRPEEAPRDLREALKSPPEVPKRPPRGPKRLQETPKRSPRDPKEPQGIQGIPQGPPRGP